MTLLNLHGDAFVVETGPVDLIPIRRIRNHSAKLWQHRVFCDGDPFEISRCTLGSARWRSI
jgi:hypothetical protein